MADLGSRSGRASSNWVFYGVVVGLIALFAGVMFNRSHAPIPEGLTQSATIAAAMDASSVSGKPVLVFATADWCGPCQSFKRGELAKDDVVQAIGANTEFTILDLSDRNDTEAGRTADMLGVRSIPAMVLMQNGEIVARWNPGSSFQTWLEQSTR